jgi:hypothetical protein
VRRRNHKVSEKRASENRDFRNGYEVSASLRSRIVEILSTPDDTPYSLSTCPVTSFSGRRISNGIRHV